MDSYRTVSVIKERLQRDMTSLSVLHSVGRKHLLNTQQFSLNLKHLSVYIFYENTLTAYLCGLFTKKTKHTLVTVTSTFEAAGYSYIRKKTKDT